MEHVYRYPSRDLPQVYWHLQDCSARFGYELRRLEGFPPAGAPRGARFELVEKAGGHRVGYIQVAENQFGAIITVTEGFEGTGKPDATQEALLAGIVHHLFECMAIPPERRARRWPR